MASTATVTATQPTLKLSANPLETEKSELIRELGRKVSSQTYGDWRDDFLRDGYVVVKNAIPAEDALAYRKRMFDWLKSINPAIDENDRSTWKLENLPKGSGIGSFYQYGVSHEKFFWDIRQEKGFRDQFAKIWGTDDLLVSFDAINVSFPGLKDPNLRVKPWPHVDQSPYRSGLSCVQGIAQLSHSGPKEGSLVVYKNSQKYTEEFFRDVLGVENWTPKDNVQLTVEQLKWFEERGCEKLKVEAEPGDLILWDSRTIHWGAQPDEDSDIVRTIAYISYSPASFATEDSLIKKRHAFEHWSGTSHWAHDNIYTRVEPALLENGQRDPKDTGEPREKPDLTNDDLLRLAGVKQY